MEVADEIVDNPVLTKWYGTFPTGEHGVFTVCSLLTEQKPNGAGEKTITAKKTFHLQEKGKIFYSAASRHNTKHFLMIPSFISLFIFLGYTVG